MISADEFNGLAGGQFVHLRLLHGPTIEGYAARDPGDSNLLRVDGLAVVDDGSVGQFSLRLERAHIEAALILKDPPEVIDSQNRVHRMRPEFWSEDDER